MTAVDHQLDTAWFRWVGDIDTHLRRFFGGDIPDMPHDLFSREGLIKAENALLRHFPRLDDVPLGDWVIDRFGIYLGEVCVRNLGAYWHNVPYEEPGWRRQTRWPHATVAFKNTSYRIDVNREVTMALLKRTGRHFEHVFNKADVECNAPRPHPSTRSNPLHVTWSFD